MKQEETTDGLFHQRLFNASVPPPPSVWKGVEAELRRRKRRIFWWWTSAGIAGTTLLLAGWWWNETSQNWSQTANIPPVVTTAAPAHPAPNIATATPAVNKQTIANPSQHIPATTTSPTVQSWKNAAFGNNSAKISKGAASQINTATAILETSPSLIAEKTPEKITETNNAAPPETQTAKNTYALPYSITLLPVSISALERAALQPTFKKWPTHIIRKKKEKDDKCYSFEDHSNVWMADVFAGPVFAQKQLRNTSSPENDQYLQQRLQTEGQGWGFNGGVRASLLVNKSYVLSAGIEYEQFTEIFKYVEPVSIEYIIKQVYDIPTGQWTIDTSKNFAIKTTKIHNRLGRLDIPLSVGYEIRQQRGGVRLMGGGAMNLYFWKRGAIIDPSTGEPGYFTPGKGTQTVFRANAGISLQGSAQFFWHPERRTRLFAEPYYRMTLQSITAPSHPLHQQYRIWGVRLGATKIF